MSKIMFFKHQLYKTQTRETIAHDSQNDIIRLLINMVVNLVNKCSFVIRRKIYNLFTVQYLWENFFYSYLLP